MSVPASSSWLKRNTKWIVLGAIALGLALLITFVGLIALAVGAAIRASDVYETGMAHAQASDRVRSLLGTPIEAGYFVGGSLQMENDRGSADLRIPLSGPRGKATLSVIATRRRGTWQYQVIEVTPESGTPIDLLENVAPDTASAPGPDR